MPFLEDLYPFKYFKPYNTKLTVARHFAHPVQQFAGCLSVAVWETAIALTISQKLIRPG
jgi:hypothetical protein